MRKSKIIEMGKMVATDLVEAERDLDTAMLSTVRLMNTMLEARRATGVPLATGHGAIKRVADAVSQLVEVRGALVDGHGELAEVKSTMPFIREMGMGDESPCPNEHASDAGLRIVA